MITEKLMKEWAINKYFHENPRFVKYRNVVIECLPNVSGRKSELIANSKVEISELNGTMVLPIPPNVNKYILINSNILISKDPLLYIETLIHELVHLIQYSEFSKCYSNNDYTLICEENDWLPFYFWSEFCAKETGLVYYFYAQKDLLELSTDILLKDTNNLFVPYEIKSYTKLQSDFNNGKVLPSNFLYGFFRVLAQISAWQKCFYIDFPQKLFHELFQTDALKAMELVSSGHTQLKNNALKIRKLVSECCGINIE